MGHHLSLNSRTEEYIPLMTLLPRREARPGVCGAEVEAAAGGAGSSRKEAGAGAGLGDLASASPGPGASDGDQDRASNEGSRRFHIRGLLHDCEICPKVRLQL